MSGSHSKRFPLFKHKSVHRINVNLSRPEERIVQIEKADLFRICLRDCVWFIHLRLRNWRN